MKHSELTITLDPKLIYEQISTVQNSVILGLQKKNAELEEKIKHLESLLLSVKGLHDFSK